jgi:hypothetical protein
MRESGDNVDKTPQIDQPKMKRTSTQIVLGAVHISLLRYTALPTRDAHFWPKHHFSAA